MITDIKDLPHSASILGVMNVLHKSMPNLQNEVIKAMHPIYGDKTNEKFNEGLDEAFFTIEFELMKILTDVISRRKDYRAEEAKAEK